MTFFTMPLGEEEYRDLGRYTAAWSQLDYLVTMALARVMSQPEQALSAVLGEATTGTKINALRRLVELMPQGDLKTLGETIVSTAQSLNDQRNFIMHGLWVSYAPSGAEPYRAAAYKPNRKKLIQASELGTMTAAIAECTELLGRFIGWDSQLGEPAGQRIIAMGFGPPERNYTADPGSAYYDLSLLGFTASR